MPEVLQEFGETWRLQHPGWRHYLWTERNMPTLKNQTLYDHAEDIAPKFVGQLRSDIARYEILHQYGGVYVDADFEALKPLDTLIEGVEAFAAWEVSNKWVNNAILGCEPGNAIMAECIKRIPQRIASRIGQRPNRLTGPHLLTAVYFDNPPNSLTVFPKHLFYPYLYNELDRINESFPDAYAVHHWHNTRRFQPTWK